MLSPFQAGHVCWCPDAQYFWTLLTWKSEPATLIKTISIFCGRSGAIRNSCDICSKTVAGVFPPISCSGRTKSDSTHTFETPKVNGEFWNWKLWPHSAIDFRYGFHHLAFAFGTRLGFALGPGFAWSGADSSAPVPFACALGLADLLTPGCWEAFFISARIILGGAERVYKIPQTFSDMRNEIWFKMFRQKSWPINCKMQARHLMRDSIVMRSAHLTLPNTVPILYHKSWGDYQCMMIWSGQWLWSNPSHGFLTAAFPSSIFFRNLGWAGTIGKSLWFLVCSVHFLGSSKRSGNFLFVKLG